MAYHSQRPSAARWEIRMQNWRIPAKEPICGKAGVLMQVQEKKNCANYISIVGKKSDCNDTVA